MVVLAYQATFRHTLTEDGAAVWEFCSVFENCDIHET